MKNTLALILLLSLLPIAAFCSTEEELRIANEFIVMMQPGQNIETLMQGLPDVQVKECLSKRMNICLLKRNTTSGGDEFLYLLRSGKTVLRAQFNHRFKERSLTPNDTDFGQQWNMLNTGQSNGTPGADIEATEAWAVNNDALTANGDTIVVAVVDGKPDINHVDLNFFTNRNEVPGNGIDDDGNGYIDDINGWNASDNSGNVQGTGWHSTHCAGIVGAKVNNNTGVAGVCNGVQIMPVVYGSTIESNVVKAYSYIRDMRLLWNSTFGTQGAFIVSTNSSFGIDNGTPTAYPLWCLLYDSMGYAGILSAGATANLNIDVEVVHDIPSECPSDYLIVVTNTTRTDARNPNAAYGKMSVDLGAPGSQVHSTVYPNLYTDMSGTSMATPHVAGVIAAMYAAACKAFIDACYEHPDSMALLVKKYLLDGAEWVSSMNGVTVTNGRLNYYRAIQNLKRYDCDSCGFDVNITKQDVTCHNLQDGNLTAVVSPGNSGDYEFSWSNGFTVPGCVGVAPGFYTVAITDTLTGCVRYYTEELHSPDDIVISSVNVSPALNGNNGNITVNAAAGNESLIYSLDSINYQSTSTFSIPANGSYTVYVKNTSGCVEEQTVLVSGIEEFQNLNFGFGFYPNPANEGLTVRCDYFNSGNLPLELLAITGQKIFETVPQTSNFKLETINLENGVYLLKVGSQTRRLLIIH